MEMFTMGPERRRDQDGREEAVASLEPLDLSSDAGGEAAEAVDVSRHWWGDLVRPDVLAVASAGVVVVTVLGLPFGQFLMNFLYSPVEFSTSWTFLPIVVATAVATALGLGAVRQAFRHNAVTWVRVVAGAATLIGLLLLVGTAVVWLYVVDAGLMDQFRNFY
ncbi:MAG TPA: hypothetical protein VFZ85_08910 [Jiangellaceae bacterium]